MMADNALLQPVMALMLLTLLVWIYLYIRRLGYVAAHKIPADQFTSPEKVNAALPETVNRPSNNLKNLFELPVLFYALCALILAVDAVDAVYVQLAWVFVGLRTVHSLVHCTVNTVMLRFTIYVLASLALWVMVGRFALRAFN